MFKTLVSILVLAVLLALVQCSDKGVNSDANSFISLVEKPAFDRKQAADVIITDTDPLALQRDPFVILDVQVNGQNLVATVQYAGGCKNHFFWCYMSPPGFEKSLPPQADLYIIHHDNNDRCKALITQEITFDLSPVGEFYVYLFGQSDPVRLNVHEYFEVEPGVPIPVIYVP
ncbi:MAG: hypothetical protein JSV52_10070 [Candidatus Zixiibacteriota bacterium]|nr:MAG: hypothetical protein JSV52_10070 [candidate division Zixibacteria bacterium]